MKFKSLSPVNHSNGDDDQHHRNRHRYERKHINQSKHFSDVVTRSVHMSSFTKKTVNMKGAVRLWLSSLYHSDPRCQLNIFYESTAKETLMLQQGESASSMSSSGGKKKKKKKNCPSNNSNNHPPVVRSLTRTLSQTLPKRPGRSQMRLSLGNINVGNLFGSLNHDNGDDNDDDDDHDVKQINNTERKESTESLLSTSDHQHKDQDDDDDDETETVESSPSSSSAAQQSPAAPAAPQQPAPTSEPTEEEEQQSSQQSTPPPSRTALLQSFAYNKHNNIDESKGNLAELLTGPPAVFTVWRPTSRDAIRLMICGQAVGKGLEIKGKSAKRGRLSGFVPFLQIHEDDHKEQIRALPRDGRVQVFFHSAEQRDAVLEVLQSLSDKFQETAHGARQRAASLVVKKLFSSRAVMHEHSQRKDENHSLFKRIVRRVSRDMLHNEGNERGPSNMSAELSVSDVSESIREELDEIFSDGDVEDDAGSSISSSSSSCDHEEKEEKQDDKPATLKLKQQKPEIEMLTVKSEHLRPPKKHEEPLTAKSEHFHPPRRHQKYNIDPYDDDEMTVRSNSSSIGSFVSSLSCALPAPRRGGKKKNKKASMMFRSKRQTTPESKPKKIKSIWNRKAKTERAQNQDLAATSAPMVVKTGNDNAAAAAPVVEKTNSFKTPAPEMKQSIDGATLAAQKMLQALSSTSEMKQQAGTMAQAALSKAAETHDAVKQKAAETRDAVQQKVAETHETVQQKAAETRDAVRQSVKDRKAAFQRLMAFDMDDYSVETIDKYAESGSKYGLELSDRLLWVALVQDKDITRPEGSDWETGRPSQPAFQDMNWNAIYQTRKNQTKPSGLPRPGFNNSRRKKEPRVVLVQSCEEDPLDPRGLIMAYEEEGRVLPVVSDFDCFTMGTRGYDYDSPLPKKQVQLVEWCLDNIKQVFELQEKDQSVNWTLRWLDVLKQHALKGFHPEIPQYGFGDGKSYGIVEEAVASLKKTGAVRHGAESFNYYFPQDLDEEFLIVSESVFDDQQLPWRYVNVEELQEFLLDRIYDGFTFPLNPKWILCDPNWKPLYDELLSSKQKQVQQSLDVWYPPTIREKIEAIHKQYPNGFVHERTGDEIDDADDMIDGTAAMDLATLELAQYMVLRRAKMKMIAVAGFFRLLVRVREKRRRKEEEEQQKQQQQLLLQEESALGSSRDDDGDDDDDDVGLFLSTEQLPG